MTTSLVDPTSLGQTLCNINIAQILEHPISMKEKREAAAFIVSRQGLPGSYRGMFALTDADRAAGRLPLATGEMPDTGASMAHIAGEEACRALLTLGVKSAAIKHALSGATSNFLSYLDNSAPRDGYYCCGQCSVALWRNMAAGGLNVSEQGAADRFKKGLGRLKQRRLDNNRWRSYPFYYTLLALIEMPRELTRLELQFAAPACERILKRRSADSSVDQVRRVISSKVLAMV